MKKIYGWINGFVAAVFFTVLGMCTPVFADTLTFSIGDKTYTNDPGNNTGVQLGNVVREGVENTLGVNYAIFEVEGEEIAYLSGVQTGYDSLILASGSNYPEIATASKVFVDYNPDGINQTGIFHNFSNLNEIALGSNYNTASVKSFHNMLGGCPNLKSVDLSSWDTTSMENIACLFDFDTGLENVTFGNSFDTSNVRDMACMFRGCSSIETIDLSGFNTSNTENIGYMFGGCSSLRDVDLTSFDTRKVHTFYNLFDSCYSLNSIDLSSFEMRAGTGTENLIYCQWMFDGCDNLQTIISPAYIAPKNRLNYGAIFFPGTDSEMPDFVTIYGVYKDDSGKEYVDLSDVPAKTRITKSGLRYLKQDEIKPGFDLAKLRQANNEIHGYMFERKGEYAIGYCHEIPFYGKSKLSSSSFGDMTVSSGNVSYAVTKVKVNKKNKTIQITGLSGADKATVKAVKNATKGTRGLSFSVNPYYVSDSDSVDVKTKKDGSIKSVKISIGGKDYKAKKSEGR